MALIYKIYPTKAINRITNKVKKLGPNNSFNIASFLTIRLFLIIFIFTITLIFNKYGYILAPLISIIFYLLSEYIFLDLPIKKRSKKLDNEALFFFEVLVLTLENGRSLKQALELTTSNVLSDISLEFKEALEEINLGKSLNESLKDLKSRIPSDAINSAILNMIECNTYGNSIVDTMYNQIDFLRQKQLLEAKGEIAKLPTKISIISVIFFLPIMFLIILAPILINFLNK